MPVALSDILSCDGRNIWMRSQKIDFDGNRLEIGLQDVDEQPAEDCHLFCQIGFLDDSYFFRSYWTYGRRVTGGYGGWLKAGRLVPSGRILCFDDTHVYGFGRKPEYMINSSVLRVPALLGQQGGHARGHRADRQSRIQDQRPLQQEERQFFRLAVASLLSQRGSQCGRFRLDSGSAFRHGSRHGAGKRRRLCRRSAQFH